MIENRQDNASTVPLVSSNSQFDAQTLIDCARTRATSWGAGILGEEPDASKNPGFRAHPLHPAGPLCAVRMGVGTSSELARRQCV